MYNLTSDDLEDLEAVNHDLYDLNQRYNDIIRRLKKKEEPYSTLKDEIEILSHEF